MKTKNSNDTIMDKDGTFFEVFFNNDIKPEEKQRYNDLKNRITRGEFKQNSTTYKQIISNLTYIQTTKSV